MTLFSLTAYGFGCMAVYYLCPKRFRWVVLLLSSYGFYASRAFSALPFILITTLTVWFAALRMDAIAGNVKKQIKEGKDTLSRDEKKQIKEKANRRRKLWFVGVLALNLAILAVLKYTDDVRGMFGASPLGLLLPLGISFYTFQSLGYLIDVYGGKYAAERNPAKFALYVSFFPQLIQGPIGRYDQLAPQLTQANAFDWQNLQRGFMLIIWGLFKKMVIADRALAPVNAIFSASAGEYGGAVAVAGVLLYSLQQYCDFSGGIDLVTGIAQQMGITLAPNFRRPYFAVSLGDFWRRWHISLGSWMRDYVFYPFAVSKPVSNLAKAVKPRFGKEFSRTLPAALGNILVFLLVGVWHGATSNYILWGLYNGVVLAFSAMMEHRYKAWNTAHEALSASKGMHIFRVLRTFLIVNIGWFFDRCAHGMDALRMMGTVVTDFRAQQISMDVFAGLGISAADYMLLGVCTALLFVVSLVQERGVVVRNWLSERILLIRWPVLIIGVVSVLLFGMYGSGFDEAAFIYYQF